MADDTEQEPYRIAPANDNESPNGDGNRIVGAGRPGGLEYSAANRPQDRA
jgi:hypothetical protein